MKPRLFIASSSENLDLAHAAQAELRRDAEVTVWAQAHFELSQPTLKSLIVAVRTSDFGLFVFSPDDVTHMRSREVETVRDNVIFELGLFIGRLGPERNFLVVPEGSENLHLPTDLLGLTAATFEARRQDGNLRAALGPACYEIRKTIHRLGHITDSPGTEAPEAESDEPLDDGDVKAALQAWIGARSPALNRQAIRFSDVDKELKLPTGSAESYLEDIAARVNLRVAHRGKKTILFEPEDTGIGYF